MGREAGTIYQESDSSGVERMVVSSGASLDVESGGELDIEASGALKLAGSAVTASAAELNAVDGITAVVGELNFLAGVTAGTVTASKALVVDASKDLATLGAVTVTSLTVAGAATATDHPINLNSITAVTDDETTDFGNIIKVNRSAGAIGGTHSGIICKHYITGGAVDGTGLVSGLYVNLKYEPTSENVAAEVSLMETRLYSSASDAIDYAWYCLAPASKIVSLIGISGTMTNFIEFKGDGAGGLTVGSDAMTANPEGGTEDAYITVRIEGGQSYQIPLYNA